MSVDITKDCRGCRDNFYNRTNCGLNETAAGPRCWNADSATLVKARDVHRDLRPPYLHLPLVSRPSCYKADGFSRVKPESLDARGFWK